MDNNAVKYGVIAGILVSALYLILYFISPGLVLSTALTYGGLVIPIAFMVKVAMEEKEANGGFLTFAEALKSTFLVYVVHAVIFYIMYYVLYNYIGPELEDLTREKAIAMMDKMSGFMGEEAAEKAAEQIDQQDFSYGIGKLMLSLLMSAIGGFIISLIVSLIMKRNPEA